MYTSKRQIALYILSLLQTVSTLLAAMVESVTLVALPFASGSFFLTLLMNEFGISPAQAVILIVWALLRVSLLVFGVIGFWHRIPRKIALILLTVTTVMELPGAILAIMIPNMIVSTVLWIIMMVLCVKELKVQMNPC